jgi:hypothetical protein
MRKIVIAKALVVAIFGLYLAVGMMSSSQPTPELQLNRALANSRVLSKPESSKAPNSVPHRPLARQS